MRLFALLWGTAIALAQPPPVPTGTVEGVVVDAATGAPIRKATITFRFKRQSVRAVSTGASGRFQASNLTPGDYRITAEGRGYLPLDDETPQGPGRATMSFTLTGGQIVSGLVLRLTPAAAVSGRIVDEDDDPIRGVPIQLWRVRYPNGQRELTSIHEARVTTDDRGMYRIAGVAPGRYYLSAFHVHTIESPATPQDELRYVRVFYPAATDPADATRIHLAPGGELENVNWKVSKVQTVRVSGRVRGSTPAFVNLSPSGFLSANDASLHSKVAPDGAFEFEGVQPGAYTLSAGGSNDGAWAFRPVVVGPSGAAGLTITMNPPIRLDGRVHIEGDPAADLSQLRIALSPLFLAGFSETVSPVRRDGSFAWDKLVPGPFRLSVTSFPPGVYLKSVRLGNQTLRDGRLLDFTSGASQPLELHLSMKAARITGVVVAVESDQPVPEATVILTPDEPERRGDLAAYSQAISDSAGWFALSNIPPGSYRAYAVHSVRENLYMDPAFLQPYEERSVGFTVAEGEQASIRLIWKP